MMALKGINVVEMAGLAPGPLCGMILKDFGANVIRVDKIGAPAVDRLARGKRSIALNLKSKQGLSILKNLTKNADVLIDPYRKGVLEKLDIGPETIFKYNPRIIIARLTGYGQSGVYADKAGHDINYLATSGVLSRLGRKNENPMWPINLLADFAGGGLTCAFGICLALLERGRTGKGQIVDSSMVEGVAYLSSWLWLSRDMFIWGEPRGQNMLDGGSHFYQTYKTKDGKYMAVGALEPKFYDDLLKGLGVDNINQYDIEEGHKKFAKIFATKTRDEWAKIFDKLDACVTPVLELDEAASHPHNRERNSFYKNQADGSYIPSPAPKLSNSPVQNATAAKQPEIGEHTKEILMEIGYKSGEVEKLINEGDAYQHGSLKSKI